MQTTAIFAKSLRVGGGIGRRMAERGGENNSGLASDAGGEVLFRDDFEAGSEARTASR